MTRRALLLIACAAFVLALALSTDGAIFFLFFWLMALMFLYALCAAAITARTLRVECSLNQDSVVRGGRVSLSICVRHRCPLPTADLLLLVSIAESGANTRLRVSARPFVANRYEQPLYCPHVGAYPAGVHSARIEDVFGIFSFARHIETGGEVFVVKPQVHLTRALSFSPGDSDMESMSRAFEDATMPTDLRAYQQGDELKKVHWKLSMRKRELLVRVYEQPMRPDALLLVDCAPPEAGMHEAAYVRDAICEAAASVASVALTGGAPVRMPLLTDAPVDISAQKAEELETVLAALGQCAFDGAQEFERVLLLETRRMRRTGSTAIVTSRMNPVIADMILRIRRMGPKVRVLLVADEADEAIQMLAKRLIRNDVEIDFAKPER